MDRRTIEEQKKMLKIFKLYEWLWLFFVAATVIGAVYMLIVGDRAQALYMLVFLFMAGFFYSFRRRMRKRHEKRILEAEEKLK